MRIARDTNGNKILKIGSDFGTKRGFSIQTLGNLPETHRTGIGPHTCRELIEYVKEHGTDRQKDMIL